MEIFGIICILIFSTIYVVTSIILKRKDKKDKENYGSYNNQSNFSNQSISFYGMVELDKILTMINSDLSKSGNSHITYFQDNNGTGFQYNLNRSDYIYFRIYTNGNDRIIEIKFNKNKPFTNYRNIIKFEIDDVMFGRILNIVSNFFSREQKPPPKKPTKNERFTFDTNKRATDKKYDRYITLKETYVLRLDTMNKIKKEQGINGDYENARNELNAVARRIKEMKIKYNFD